MNLKPHFSRFLAADPDRLHFAAHSHHLWPDVTFAAQQRCWDDAARLVDGKWAHIFGELYPAAQRGVARILGLSDPTTLAFAPNTHELLMRLLSTFAPGQTIRVLTTDGEFHSFTRQMQRLAEDGLVQLTVVPTQPFASFSSRFAELAARGGHDLAYLSQVFYNSGFAVDDLSALVDAVAADETVVVIDGYHGFLARPTDLSAIEARAFFLSGGYKYAMAGEGVCFLHAATDRLARPRDTGWFAAFGALEAGSGEQVAYARDAARFLGATFDPVGLYRLGAVMNWLTDIGTTVADIHAHAHDLQQRFVAGLEGIGLDSLRAGQLVVPLDELGRGNFLTFQTDRAERIHRALRAANIVTDWRGDRLRFGFGLYHDAEDVERLCTRLRRTLR